MFNLEHLKKGAYDYGDIDKLIKKLEQQLKPIQASLKELKQEKKSLQKELCEIMEKTDCSIVNVKPENSNDEPYAIKYSVTNSVVPLTQAQIKDNLIKFFLSPEASELSKMNPADRGLFVYNFVSSKVNRNVNVRQNIKIVKFVENDEI
jgi:chromosome segregation ATPase